MTIVNDVDHLLAATELPQLRISFFVIFVIIRKKSTREKRDAIKRSLDTRAQQVSPARLYSFSVLQLWIDCLHELIGFVS